MQLDPFFVTARSIIVIVRACRSHTTSISSTTPPPFPVDPSALTATAPHPPPSSPPSRIQVVDAFVRSPAPRPCRQVINRCDNGHPLLLLLRNRASLLLASSLHHSRPLLLVVVDVAIARPTFRINRNRRPHRVPPVPPPPRRLPSSPPLRLEYSGRLVSCRVALSPMPTSEARSGSVAVVHPLPLPLFVDCCVLHIQAARPHASVLSSLAPGVFRRIPPLPATASTPLDSSYAAFHPPH